ncbi:glycine zipper 2TM domain-containing protein [Novosphingobium jiangmenense]|uniref:17 kDa surface antigen n=1 Tax=Novosphingobium jiangmenense TaxID=2791981 RepID=A0ABS0HE94_9SPHN|nr:glycine zipper 2TM domain-containing protein [Novosphingobium jiangmenense]
MGVGGVSAPVSAQSKRCDAKTGKVVGAVVGGILGGLLGRSIDSKGDRTPGTLIGGLAGAFIGSKIGASLDKCEQQKVADATKSALEGSPTKQTSGTWVSETREGVSGTVTAEPAKMTSDGKQCRAVTRVNYVNGEEIHDTPTYCRVPPSTAWEMA